MNLSAQLSVQEQKAAVDAFKNPDTVLASGVRLANQKFFAISANDRSIYGKKQVRAHPLYDFMAPAHFLPPTIQQ